MDGYKRTFKNKNRGIIFTGMCKLLASSNENDFGSTDSNGKEIKQREMQTSKTADLQISL